ncbi:MAG: DNA polymerase I [Deltaproteobacteria bacterium]|nr:MAG: DNA polymerase I [Deltaproteobacteria bacterium]
MNLKLRTFDSGDPSERLPHPRPAGRLRDVKVKNSNRPVGKSGRSAAPSLKTDARKVLLLDGHSLAFRAFFALPDTLVTSSGQITNAVYGFTAMLIKLLADERPQAVVVCFDKGAPQFRLDRYVEYKANRAETPDAFRQQLPLIREVLESLRIPVAELEGYEADDLLATLAKHCRKEGSEVMIVTGDRDILQLVRDGVLVIMTRRGISDVIRYDSRTVLERYGVPPEKWIDFVALKGETSDNLPGVPGVGDKTAAQLVSRYGDIEQIIAHADELSPKLRDAVKERAHQVRINKELGRLLDDVPLDIDPATIRLEAWNEEEVRKLFTSLEFRTLHERLTELKIHAAAAPPALELESILELASAKDLRDGVAVALAWSSDWLALCDGPGEARMLPLAAAMQRLAGFLKDAKRQKIAHDAKALFRSALSAGVEIQGLHCDTKIAAYLLEPGSAPGYTVRDTVGRYLRVSIDDEKPELQAGEQASLAFGADERRRVAREAVAIQAVAPVLEEHLRNQGLWELATALEFPLVEVLARMEHNGILVDRSYLEKLNADFGQKMATLERTIQQLAGENFNVNSQPQLQRILFEKLALPKTRKIKTGYSTDAAELEKIAGAHPIIASLLEYREVSKLKNGFTEMLLALIGPTTNRIHTTYEQTTAATGRLSSTAPNLQNIPIRGELGRQIRRAFMAPPGHVLLSADYSQIELRVLAHLSEDEAFLQAFAQGHDFHAAIAAKVYGVALTDVTPAMRNQVKQFSYGIAYGMSTYGVAQRLGVEMEKAASFIEAYYAQFPKVKEFLSSQVEKAKIDGFTTTMFGRRRYLPELRSSNYNLRTLGERMALNAPIQGSAADIIKRAMIRVDAALRREPLAKMLLTVHDELVFEVPTEKLERARAVIEEGMTKAADLQCGLTVEVHTGMNWAEAHA